MPTSPEDMERARQIKWREEGFDHELEVPRLGFAGWIVLLVIIPFGLILWPLEAIENSWARFRRWLRRP